MGEAISRGWAGERSASLTDGSGVGHCRVMAVMQIGSLAMTETIVGAGGQPRPREQRVPEQGEYGCGTIGRVASDSAMGFARSSIGSTQRCSRRSASDVTASPHPARASAGARPAAARSTQSTPANRGFARLEDCCCMLRFDGTAQELTGEDSLDSIRRNAGLQVSARLDASFPADPAGSGRWPSPARSAPNSHVGRPFLIKTSRGGAACA